MFGFYRLVLALMVVLLHYGGVPFVGFYAVFGFFTLSGYLMTLVMQTSYGYTLKGISGYALNRFLRIYPLYWVGCLIALTLIFLLDQQYQSGFNPSLVLPQSIENWLRNIFLVLNFDSPRKLIAPAWALTVELFYYICIGLGLSRNRKSTLAWLIGSLVYTSFLFFSGAPFYQRYYTIAAASLPFAAGAAIYHWRDKLNQTFALITDSDFAPVSIYALIAANWFAARHFVALSGWGFYLNFMLCAAMVVILFSRKSLPWISRSLDSKMGDLSYPIYLVHFPLAFLFLFFCKQLGLGISGPEPMFFLITLVPLLFVSWILAVGVEKPVELVRSAIKRRIATKD